MKTKKELLAEFHLNPEGRITDPGKFEKNPLYIPYLYCREPDDIAWDGEETEIHVYFINSEDRLEFPELGSWAKIYIWEDNQGFVWFDKEDYPS